MLTARRSRLSRSSSTAFAARPRAIAPLAARARDALALELPEQVLCRPDCAGLCPECGKDLNVEPHDHEQESGDPRWAALAELREKL